MSDQQNAQASFPRRFEGRTVLVTGAGTGFGAEIAVRAAQEGAHVVVHYNRSREGAGQTAKRIEQTGGQAALVQADITSWDAIRALADAAFAAFGAVAAGTSGHGLGCIDMTTRFCGPDDDSGSTTQRPPDDHEPNPTQPPEAHPACRPISQQSRQCGEIALKRHPEQ